MVIDCEKMLAVFLEQGYSAGMLACKVLTAT
jgi:hypothetical protein